MAAAAADEAMHIEKPYLFGERLNKSQNMKDYQGFTNAAKMSLKYRQLAAQLIQRVLDFFPEFSSSSPAIDIHLDLSERQVEQQLGVRVQASGGHPLFLKDTREYILKIVRILVQSLQADEYVERDAARKALMALLRSLDVKASFTALFKHIGTVDDPSQDDVIREKFLSFIRDKVFPIKAEVLKLQEQMERHITYLIKKILEDVTGAEFRMFMDFLKSLNIFGEKAPKKCMVELIGIVEGQADLDAQFNVSDADHIGRLISYLFMVLPFILDGASSSKFLILPVLDKLPNERRLELLKALAEVAPFTTPEDSRHILPSVVQPVKQTEKPNTTTQWRTSNDILAMTKVLLSKEPSFIGDKSLNLSWKELPKAAVPSNRLAKRFKGTSTAAVIGSHEVYLVAESRSSSSEEGEKGRIKSGNADKLRVINDYIVAALAGNSGESIKMIEEAQKAVGEENDIYKVQTACEQYITEWKGRPGNKDKGFPARVTLCGWYGSEFVIVVVGWEKKVEKNKDVLVATGSGQEYVEEYVNDQLRGNKFNGDQDYLDCLCTGVAYSCMRTSWSGGIIKAAVVPMGGKVELLWLSHALAALWLYHHDLKNYWDKSLLCVSRGFRYSHKREIDLKHKIVGHVGTVVAFHVLGVSTDYIVRVIEFPTIDAKGAAFRTLAVQFLQEKDKFNVYIPTADAIKLVSKEFETIIPESDDFL
ncbi:putative proteasome, subunit alpha/beta, apoptosis inhibitory 5, armadillo-like helical [Rosa chinensis]|uniref:Putative proteasome, subunit alpha/beta, apoptosis inhibitory 5, armadillo-like helical n=1 Tax=Rosa chinensis TaxID=74649 RepID=A0A2P6SJ93_ROSCH|nr:apoptosis inhibitor 5-like protein API5 [Rosa chinensis]XP_040374038.1 apoptosis inhibitor 5-like protein API5 [Rosa chinensis]XP_040374042.1 apoptosis inhibitor 5-like protein API5 [Rosa chinensis]PRQ58750.1 putative proteasome, subunit alpha/beta, apoptosis inhibitory 5, armadillo-like helical [Rosa chinensis]